MHGKDKTVCPVSHLAKGADKECGTHGLKQVIILILLNRTSGLLGATAHWEQRQPPCAKAPNTTRDKTGTRSNAMSKRAAEYVDEQINDPSNMQMRSQWAKAMIRAISKQARITQRGGTFTPPVKLEQWSPW